MFRSQKIIIRKYICTSLKLLNYLKNTEFKILKIIPGVVAATPTVTSLTHSTTRVTTYTCYTVRMLRKLY